MIYTIEEAAMIDGMIGTLFGGANVAENVRDAYQAVRRHLTEGSLDQKDLSRISAAVDFALKNQFCDEHIPVVYTIDLSSQKVAEAVSECTGARIERLWSMQTISRTDFDAGETYLTLMQRNYEALKGGLL